MLALKRVRLEIESLAAEWATPRVGEAEIAKLEILVGRMAAAAVGDRKDYVRYNHEFHFVIYRAAGSDVLYAIIENLWLQISPYFHLLRDSGNPHTSHARHERMSGGLKARNGSIVRQAIRNDVEAAGKVLLCLLD